MKQVLISALICVLLGACTSPEEDRIFPFAYEIRDFDNGLRSVVVDSGYPNLVALYIVVQVGSRNEVEPGRTGFAHLFEHMMFRGTPRFPSDEWERIMQEAGAQTNAYTTDDRTVYHAVFAKEDLEKILELEADRFQNLEYSEEVYRTETQAVLSEYNKSFANPFNKLDEALMNASYDEHTYKHTTIGFVEDVEAMPEMYDYGLEFFERYYRPEYTIVSVVGDVDFEQTQAMIERHWGGWARGSHAAEIPQERPQTGPREVAVDFHAQTLPMIAVSFRGPAYDDESIDSAALDVISYHAFGENSDIYKKLVIQEQKVSQIVPAYYDHVDPYPFAIWAQVKKAEDVAYVQQEIETTIESLKESAVPAEQLAAAKSRLRYQFALGLDSTSSIAGTLAHFLGLRRSPETINKRYNLYQAVTPEDLKAVASKYFQEEAKTVARLAYQGGEQ